MHVESLAAAIESNCHVLVEKPLANSLVGVAPVLSEARRRGLIVMAGYNLRFMPALGRLHELVAAGALGRVTTVTAEFGQYLPTWRPSVDYRRNYIVSAGESGGIILEESHEFDYVRWLAGPVDSVYCAAGRLSDLEMEAEDTALITMRHKNGALSVIHVDCVQHGYRRVARVVGTEGTAEWRFPGTVEIVQPGGKSTTEEHGFEFSDTYVEEMRTFLGCVGGRAQPPVDGYEALECLRLALAARESAQERREVAV